MIRVLFFYSWSGWHCQPMTDYNFAQSECYQLIVGENFAGNETHNYLYFNSSLINKCSCDCNMFNKDIIF